jgi:hypothetical protein
MILTITIGAMIFNVFVTLSGVPVHVRGLDHQPAGLALPICC